MQFSIYRGGIDCSEPLDTKQTKQSLAASRTRKFYISGKINPSRMRMNRKALVLAGIFLAIAIVSPGYVLIEEAQADEQDLANLGPNLADETQATHYFQAVTERHQTTLTILLIVEVVFIILFALSLWFALKP
jgi:hypothetical protein